MERLNEIDAARTLIELLAICKNAYLEQGFHSIGYVHHAPLGIDGIVTPVSIYQHRIHPAYVQAYSDNKWYVDDPIVKSAFRTGQPQYWKTLANTLEDVARYADLFHLLKKLAPFGGVSIPTFGPNNTNGCFAVGFTTPEELQILESNIRHYQNFCQQTHLKYCEIASVQRDEIDLTSREIQTMNNVLKGLTTNEIADNMKLSAHTVNTYIKRVFEKFDVTDRVSASLKFLALGYTFYNLK